MDFPTDVDYIIAGTGLAESIIAASLAITGNSVLHIDRDDYYGGYIASFRFPELIQRLLKWRSGKLPSATSSNAVSDSTEFSESLIQHCSFESFVPDIQEAEIAPNNVLSAPKTDTVTVVNPPIEENAFIHTDVNDKQSLDDVATLSSEVTLESTPKNEANTARTPIAWSQSTLMSQLRRADFDILPKLIFAESPMVKTMLRADVTRYLEFQAVTRLLTIADVAVQSTSTAELTQPRLIRVPVSRGEVFRTRLLSLTQKRMLVGFLEWCAIAATLGADENEEAELLHASVHGTDYLEYMDRPLKEYLQLCRKFDSAMTSIVISCLALSTDSITLRQAFPRFARSLSSMNRFGPYPMLWPNFGCGELPQSFCRMCAVFSGIYCLGKALVSVTPISTDQTSAILSSNVARRESRSLRVRLSTGEEVTTSALILSAHQVSPSIIEPQIKRWIARAVLISDASIFPVDLKREDITLLPLRLDGQVTMEAETDTVLEPAFLLELPVEPYNQQNLPLFIAHLTAACDTCVDPKCLFKSVIDRFYSKYEEQFGLGAERKNSSMPQLLWSCFFTLPDLSGVHLSPSILTSLLTSPPADATSEEAQLTDAILFVPGQDSTLVMDAAVDVSERIFRRAYSLVSRGFRSQRQIVSEVPDNTGENGSTVATSSFVSLDAHWDGLFPPRPPRSEDLVIMDTTTEMASLAMDGTSSATQPLISSQQPQSGHGDWTETVPQMRNSINSDSELVTAVELSTSPFS